MAQKISESIGVIGKTRKCGKNVFVLQYSCRRGLNLANWIYRDEDLRMDRKFQQYKIAIENKEVSRQ